MTTDLPPDQQPAPCKRPDVLTRDHDRAQVLAESLGCVTVEELCALGGIKPSTAEAWAKRGKGPPYVILGKRRLYPREALREFLLGRVRERHTPAGSLL